MLGPESRRKEKLLEPTRWLTGERCHVGVVSDKAGSPRRGSPTHTSRPEVLLCDSDSCINADTDVISICVFFENNAFQKQYDSLQ